MKITVLMENTCGNPLCECEHGFSLYIETKNHKVLMDTGASAKILDNAEKLGVSLLMADTVIVSHGHYDHAGGLLSFGEINKKAVIYMQKSALGDYYHGERYIGIDKRIAQMGNIRMIEGREDIDQELSVFAGITGRRFWPRSNLELSVRIGGKNIQDEFVHEQCLVIREEKNVLVSGCAHNGILNILDKYREEYGGYPDAVISGFHMMKKTDDTEQEKRMIQSVAEELAQKDIIFYTGHCTGQKAIDMMKPIMQDQLVQLHCGDVMHI